MTLSLRGDALAANMGAVTEAEVTDFAALVADDLGCEWAWTTAGSIYIAPVMHIDRSLIGQYPWQAIECVVHEATHHELHPETGHGASFFRAYAGLLSRFAAREVPA